jgi:hypothetical protein
MSETWTSLLAALVGAIVGGAASLAGTMVANKRQMATNARMRLYDELLPKLADAVDAVIDPQVPEDQMAEEAMPELLAVVRRVGAIAGRQERRAVHNLVLLWSEYGSATAIPPIPSPLLATDDMFEDRRESAEEPAPEDKPRPGPYAERQAKGEALLGQIREEIRAFSDHLGAKLG